MTSTYICLSIIGLAALLHGSFQLGTSLLTLLSGHSLSVKRSQFRLFRLTSSFLLGAGTMIILLLSFMTLLLNSLNVTVDAKLIWSILSGLLIGIGISVWLTYYRTGKGTTLWIPRGLADFLMNRVVATKRSAESYILGLSGVIGEILFIVAPLSVAAFSIIFLPASWQLIAVVTYSVIASLPLVMVWVLVSYNVKISRIQAWRERNKKFLQHTTTLGLIILGTFTYTYQVLGVAS